MFYGDGGAGKTTLMIDLGLHLAAGDDWLGIPIGRAVRVAIVENEGPRPLFRAKLRRKLDAWKGSPLEDRLLLLEDPWSRVSLDDPAVRDALAAKVAELELDALLVGPVTRSGMNEAGTLQQVRDYADLLGEVRAASGRRVTFLLAHHENRGGQVSGAWEGAVDTLFHVQAQGNGQTRLYVQKARWSPEHHKQKLQLAWADGEGFDVLESEERDDNTIADEILALRARERRLRLEQGGRRRPTGKGDRLRGDPRQPARRRPSRESRHRGADEALARRRSGAACHRRARARRGAGVRTLDEALRDPAFLDGLADIVVEVDLMTKKCPTCRVRVAFEVERAACASCTSRLRRRGGRT